MDRTPEMLIEWAFPGLFYAVWLYFGSNYLMNTEYGAGIMIPANKVKERIAIPIFRLRRSNIC